jgi:hypothetical protein
VDSSLPQASRHDLLEPLFLEALSRKCAWAGINKKAASAAFLTWNSVT